MAGSIIVSMHTHTHMCAPACAPACTTQLRCPVSMLCPCCVHAVSIAVSTSSAQQTHRVSAATADCPGPSRPHVLCCVYVCVRVRVCVCVCVGTGTVGRPSWLQQWQTDMM